MKNNLFALLLVSFLLMSCGSGQQKAKVTTDSFESIFNGKNFDGWETYIGVPEPSVDMPGWTKNEEGKYTQPVGVNNDPLKVFSIVEVDGAPALRISGQIFGSFATTKEYENYHLRLEAKWGTQQWPPLENQARNSGVLYHGVGEYGKSIGVWKFSHECQMMADHAGDSYLMGDTYCDITARADEKGRYTFDPDAPTVSFGPKLEAGKFCNKSIGNEKPVGEWNVVEVFCYADTSVHIINGKVNMVCTNHQVMLDGQKIPLAKGVIQLQSEGSEIYYRNIEIKPITRIPAEYLQ